MKKIFILTGEPSGDKLASEVVKKIINFDKDINFLGVCGKHLKALGINSIFDQNEITYLAFSDIILNIFKIRKKINHTVNEIIKFQPDILFTVDSPDFSLRVSKKVKQINPNIKTIHYIAPKVWAWREGRVKKMKKFLDHVLLLFNFEKKYFDKENLKSTFVGHPLLDDQLEKNNISIKQIIDKKVISIFAGSRISEINMHMPILIDFIKKMNNKNFDYKYVFHSTEKLSEKLKAMIKENNLHNVDVIHDEKLKSNILKQSIFAIVKSGTVSLEVCKNNIPSIIIYKMNFFNYLLAKSLLNIKFVNMVNIINNKEVIPELIQKECNSDEIYRAVNYLLKKPDLVKNQLLEINKTLNEIKSSTSSTDQASKVVLSYLV
jgi:lipid-A-disaccharide synthase